MKLFSTSHLVLCAVIFIIAVLFFSVYWIGVGSGEASTPPERKTLTVAGESRLLPNERKVINWMGHWYKADKRYDLVLEIKNDFSFRNQDVAVNLRFPEQIVGTNDKSIVAHLISNMIKNRKIDWDIVWMDNHIYQFVAEDLNDPLWGRKYLVDFEKVPGFTESQKPFIIEDSCYRNQTGGALVGPYIEGYYYALYYNKNLADKIGLKIKDFDMTFDDFLGYVKTVYQYNQGSEEKIPIIFDSYDMPSVEVLFQNLVKSWVNDYVAVTTEQGSAQKIEAMYKGFQAFEQLGKYRPLISSYKTNAWFMTRDVPLNDKVLFYISGTWMYSRWRDIDIAKSSKMIPAELAVFKPVNYCLGGVIPTWAVMKDSSNSEAAIRLIMSASTPRIAERWVQYTKTPTGLVGDFSKATMGNDMYEIYQRHMSEKYGRRVQYSFNAAYLLGKDNNLMQRYIVEALWGLLKGEITADQAQRSIVEKLK